MVTGLAGGGEALPAKPEPVLTGGDYRGVEMAAASVLSRFLNRSVISCPTLFAMRTVITRVAMASGAPASHPPRRRDWSGREVPI